MLSSKIRIRGLQGIPEILSGTNLATEILRALASAAVSATPREGRPEESDPIVIVVAQKVVSKSEGCLVRLDGIVPSARAQVWASEYHKDPRMVEVVLQQARRIVKMDRGIIIAETHHGYVCANAGVDASNAPSGMVVLLPQDPDKSAARLRQEFEQALHRSVAVIVSDTFGRPWRKGLTNVALGVSGLSPFIDYRGQVDSYGRLLQATVLAVADELAGAAELVMGKTTGIPAAIIEGFRYTPVEASGRDLIRPAEEDLFR
ncbi:MAG: coenzyme F420-0:L-glutamate ligase [Acidobacteriia bacterium]|nr:coenzyme F420-0:L-glutamate ligase [Terriglobia bacterium]